MPIGPKKAVRVLIVEAQPVMQIAMTRLISHGLHAEVTSVESREAALSAVASNEFDVLIGDVAGSQKDEVSWQAHTDLLTHIQHIDDSLQSVFTTTDERTAEMLRAAGAFAAVAEPFCPFRFIYLIRGARCLTQMQRSTADGVNLDELSYLVLLGEMIPMLQQRSLRQISQNMTFVTTPQAALTATQDTDFDVVVTDQETLGGIRRAYQAALRRLCPGSERIMLDRAAEPTQKLNEIRVSITDPIGATQQIIRAGALIGRAARLWDPQTSWPPPQANVA